MTGWRLSEPTPGRDPGPVPPEPPRESLHFSGCPQPSAPGDRDPDQRQRDVETMVKAILMVVALSSRSVYQELIKPTAGMVGRALKLINIRVNWTREEKSLQIGSTPEEQARADLIRRRARALETIEMFLADGGRITLNGDDVKSILGSQAGKTLEIPDLPRESAPGPAAPPPPAAIDFPVADLPVRPRNVVAIMELARDRNAGVADALPHIKDDPALVAGIIRYANSAFVAPPQEITSLQVALTRCGYQTLVTLALSLSLRGKWLQRCTDFDYAGFWRWSAASGAAARFLAERAGLADPEEAFTLGLLAQIGRLGMATAWPQRYAALLADLQAGPGRRLAHAEKEAFAFDHTEAASILFERWGLPAAFSQAAKLQYERGPFGLDARTESLASVLSCACAIARVVTATGRTPVMSDLLRAEERGSQAAGADHDFGEIFDGAVEHWGQVGRILDVPTPSVPGWQALLAAAC